MTQTVEGCGAAGESKLHAADAEVREMLLCILRALVDEPEKVELIHLAEENHVAFQVRTAPDDAGKVIGRKGRTAQAIRLILNGSAMKNGRVYTLDLAPQPKPHLRCDDTL